MWALMVQAKNDLRAFLAALYRIAVETAHPAAFLPRLLPVVPSGRVIILAAGKAAGSMAEVAENYYLDTLRLPAERRSGVAVARPPIRPGPLSMATVRPAPGRLASILPPSSPITIRPVFSQKWAICWSRGRPILT